MTNGEPWWRDRRLIAVPVGWRRCAWNARLLAAEHGLIVTVSVAWAPPDTWGTPALVIAGDVTPTATLPARRRENQRLGLSLVALHLARASRFCMACCGEDFPALVRLQSGGFVDVVAVLCLDCQVVAEHEGGMFWPTISRCDPLAQEEHDDQLGA